MHSRTSTVRRQLSVAIADALQLSSKTIQKLRMAAIIHDNRKIRVPAKILNRPRKLSEAGFQLIGMHPQADLEARIIAFADIVAAMSSHRPYRPALGIEVVLAELLARKGTSFEPEIVEACRREMAG